MAVSFGFRAGSLALGSGGGGGTIPSELQANMDAVFNKKFNTSGQTYDSDGWPDDVNLMGPLSEKTVSGAIAVIEDGADDVPTKSVKVTLPASLSGVSAVSVVNSGKNLLLLTQYGDKNIVNQTTGAITRNGTTSWAWSYDNTTLRVTLPAGTYKLYCWLSVAGGSGNRVRTYDSDENIITGADASLVGLTYYEGTFTLTEKKSLGVGLKQPENSTAYIAISTSATTLSQYELYNGTQYTASLGRTIYGGEVDIVNGTGKENCAKIKFSELNWTYYTSGTNPIFYANNVPDMRIYSRGEMPNIAIDGYTTRTAHSRSNLSTNMANMECSAIENAQTIAFRNDAYTSVSDMLEDMGNEYIVYEVATPTDFAFDGQEIDTMLGYNAFWSDDGDTEVTYRSSGTITPVVPALITKTITANDTYSAEDDGADGYSSVAVNVQPNVGTKSITENGIYVASADSLDGYSSVTVDVSAGTDLFNLASQTTFDLTDNTYKTSALTIPERMFNGNQRIRTVNLSGVKTVENYAFYSCKATSISLPDVETIGYQAFWQARGATDVPLSIPNVVSIGEEAFKEAYVCGESTSNRFLDISKCVSIGHNAFRSTRINGFDLSSAETFGNCPWFSGWFSMTTALFPKIKTAGDQLLRACTFTNLVMGPDWESCGSGLAGYDADWPNRYIYIYAVNPPVMAGGLSISRRPVAFYVPAESVDAYKAAPYWSDFASLFQPLPDDHLTIDTWLT